jgi:hypothetical protein
MIEWAMAADWIVGLFGAVGTGIGSAATIAASWMATRTQRQLAVGDRGARRAEVRRAACAEYLTTVDSFMDGARELVSRMENNAPKPECARVHAAYLKSWEEFQRQRAPVVIAGPKGLGIKAEELHEHLGGLADVCDAWYEAYKAGPVRSRIGRFGDARLAASEAREEFITAAQDYAHYTYGPG